MKQILVLSKEEFALLEKDDTTAALRIIDPSDLHKIKKAGYVEEMIIGFNDVEEPIGRYIPIEPHQAFQIVSFLQRNIERDRFVFHCNFGQSRSHTCAVFFAQKMLCDEVLASLLTSAPGKSINFAVWNALNEALNDITFESNKGAWL